MGRIGTPTPLSVAASIPPGAYAKGQTGFPANTVIAFGDSIINHGADEAVSATQGYYDRQSVIFWAQLFLGQRLTLVSNKGVSGNTTTQMLARLATDVLSANPIPDFVVMDGGANDIGNVSLATTKSNLQSMWSQIAAKGSKVVYFTLNPSGNYGTGPTATSPVSPVADAYAFNRWVRAYAAANPGFILVDCWSSLIDVTQTASAPPIAGYVQGDGIHPNFYGAARMGRKLAEAMEPFIQGLPVVAEGNSDPANFLANPMMTGTGGTITNGGTGSVPTSWTVNGGGGAIVCAASVVSRLDGVEGQWAQLYMTSAVNNVQFVQTGQAGVFGTKVTVGDTIEAMIEVETDPDCIDLYSMIFSIESQAGAAIARGLVYPSGDGVVTGVDVFPRRLWFKTPQVVVPSGVTRLDTFLRIKPPASAATTPCTVRIGRCRLQKAGV